MGLQGNPDTKHPHETPNIPVEIHVSHETSSHEKNHSIDMSPHCTWHHASSRATVQSTAFAVSSRTEGPPLDAHRLPACDSSKISEPWNVSTHVDMCAARESVYPFQKVMIPRPNAIEARNVCSHNHDTSSNRVHMTSESCQ